MDAATEFGYHRSATSVKKYSFQGNKKGIKYAFQLKISTVEGKNRKEEERKNKKEGQGRMGDVVSSEKRHSDCGLGGIALDLHACE